MTPQYILQQSLCRAPHCSGPHELRGTPLKDWPSSALASWRRGAQSEIECMDWASEYGEPGYGPAPKRGILFANWNYFPRGLDSILERAGYAIEWSDEWAKSSDPLRDAQLNLAGRTHYVDADTLRFFRSRILSARATNDGLLYAIVESCSGDHEHKTRIFRHVIFDIFGTVIDRPNVMNDHTRVYKSQAPAKAAMWRALETIDADAVTRAAIETHRASHERELCELTNRLDAIRAEKLAAA